VHTPIEFLHYHRHAKEEFQLPMVTDAPCGATSGTQLPVPPDATQVPMPSHLWHQAGTPMPPRWLPDASGTQVPMPSLDIDAFPKKSYNIAFHDDEPWGPQARRVTKNKARKARQETHQAKQAKEREVSQDNPDRDGHCQALRQSPQGHQFQWGALGTHMHQWNPMNQWQLASMGSMDSKAWMDQGDQWWPWALMGSTHSTASTDQGDEWHQWVWPMHQGVWPRVCLCSPAQRLQMQIQREHFPGRWKEGWCHLCGHHILPETGGDF